MTAQPLAPCAVRARGRGLRDRSHRRIWADRRPDRHRRVGWQGGDRLTLTADAGVVTARRDPGGMITLPGRPYVAIPAAVCVTNGKVVAVGGSPSVPTSYSAGPSAVQWAGRRMKLGQELAGPAGGVSRRGRDRRHVAAETGPQIANRWSERRRRRPVTPAADRSGRGEQVIQGSLALGGGARRVQHESGCFQADSER